MATDKAALVALYNATDGPNWTTNTNWTSEEPLSSWHGVSTNSDGRVTALVLNNNGLAGTLPADLGDLSELERLDLRDNALTGPLPSELANLTNLTSLLLNKSRALTGPLPAGLRQLADLATVQIQDTEMCAPGDDAFQAWWETITKTGLICPPAEESVIDVAVVYTSTLREQILGGTTPATKIAAVKDYIDLTVAEANMIFANSGVHLRIALVAVEEVAYTEVNSLTDLARLRSPDDGYMDEVHALRDRVAADIVVLLHIDRSGTAGKAYIMNTVSSAFASSAFAVFSSGGGSTFAHELAHIMGLQHDRYTACTGTRCRPVTFPYAYGYLNRQGLRPDAPYDKRWYTLMATPTQAARPFYRVPRFSNPEQTHSGDPFGSAGLAPSASKTDGPADAVRALNRTRGYVANFRQAPDLTVSFGAAAYEASEDGSAATVTVQTERSAHPPDCHSAHGAVRQRRYGLRLHCAGRSALCGG